MPNRICYVRIFIKNLLTYNLSKFEKEIKEILTPKSMDYI